MRVLLTDLVFPNKYAKWRLVEIRSFIDKYETDILIPSKLGHYVIPFDFDYNDLLESHSLERYDLLIFNPAYNHLNKYNSDGFDGCQYNSKYKVDYMFRLKKYRHQPLDLTDYDIVYHIFLYAYSLFNGGVQYPHDKQYIHLYPGGGLVNPMSLRSINPAVKLIGTQHFITEYVQGSKLPDLNSISLRSINQIINLIGTQHFITEYVQGSKLPNLYLESFGGCFMYQNESIALKEKNTGPLNVCFTTIGPPEEKGSHHYVQIVQIYKKLYPQDNIKFFSIGICINAPNVTYLGLLSQKEVDLYYREKIDVLLNLDTGRALNGFPLGIEGLVQGVVLFTPDYHDGNRQNNFNFGPELPIINVANHADIVARLKQLHDDRDLLHEYSLKCQERAIALFGYDAVMERIFKFIKETLKMDFRNLPNPGYPTGALGCLQYKFREDAVNTQCLDYSRALIQSYALKVKSGLIVEIGVLGGATLLSLVDIAIENGNKLLGIDPFEKITIYNGVPQTEVDPNMIAQSQATYKFNRENLERIIKKYGLEETITVVSEPSEFAVNSIEDGSINLLHIDGDHSTDGVYRDLTNYCPKMVRPGGVIIGDDFNWRSVAAGLRRFCEEKGLTYESVHEKFIIKL